MAYRDLVVIMIVFLAAPITLFSPYFGLLMWTWIAYFNPHRYAWGVAKMILPVGWIMAIPTLVGTLFAPKNTQIFTRETYLLIGLWFWFAFTTFYISNIPDFAGHVTDATWHLEVVSKILLMTFLSILLVTSQAKLRGLVMVILLSFGLRAMFASLFYLETAGEFRIFGPDGTFLSDNNDFALALNMTIPMFYYMAQAEPKRWMRVGLRVLMVSVLVSVIGTYSRGGLVGLAVITAAIIAKSQKKFISLLLVSMILVFMVIGTTTVWKDRMTSFMEGNLDESAYARLIAWGGGWNLAMDYPVTGGGFDVFTDQQIFPQYVPVRLRAALYGKLHTLHSSHSIYIQMLGEQGFVGLAMFLLLLFTCFASLRKIRKQARGCPEVEWVVPYTHMFEVSLLVYMTNGATLGRAYFDFFYQIIACIIILKVLLKTELGITAVDEANRSEVLDQEAVLSVA